MTQRETKKGADFTCVDSEYFSSRRRAPYRYGSVGEVTVAIFSFADRPEAIVIFLCDGVAQMVKGGRSRGNSQKC